MNIARKPLEERTPEDLSFYQPAEALIEDLLDGRRPDAAGLKMLAYIKRHIPDDETALLNIAIQNLTACAYQHSEVFYDHAEQYADSLLTQPRTAESPGPVAQVERFQSLADKLADIIADPYLPDSASGILEAAAIEIIGQVGLDSIPLIRGSFAKACVKAAEAEADARRCLTLTDQQKQRRKILELAVHPVSGTSDEAIDAALRILETGKVPAHRAAAIKPRRRAK